MTKVSATSCPCAGLFTVILFHIFTMARLERDTKIPVNFTSGKIITLEPMQVSKAPGNYKYVLDLHNKKGDILLQIWFSTNRIFFRDRARRSLGDGWGEPHEVEMTEVDLKDRSVFEITISIHHYLTESEFGRYQILFNGVTIAHFEKRFPGPATEIAYWIPTPGGPRYWFVDVYQIEDLLREEQLVLEPGRAPLPPVQSLDSMAISIQPSHFIPTQTYASISWDHGKEIRLYYLGPRNVLREYAYSASKGKNSWHYGDLHSLKIVLDPTSSIAAMRLDDDIICIYYQDPNTDFIQVINQRGSTQPWKEALPIAKAVKGSSFAIIRDPTNELASRIYYQDPELHLRELCYDHLGNTDQGVLGGFNPGVQPRGTPITAEVVQGGDVDINVTWRDARGRVASASWSKSSGWDLSDPKGVRAPLDGRD